MSPRALPASARIWGRVARSDGAVVAVAGLAGLARLGDGLAIETPGRPVTAEVIAADERLVTAMILGPSAGIATGQRVDLLSRAEPAPDARWLGTVLDADARLPDGRAAPRGERPTALEAAPPDAARRRGFGARLSTGLAALDTVLPLCRGQRIGVFAGSGVGKSRLLAALARGTEADVIVIALIGERGHEVTGFVRDALGQEALARTVVVAATSDRPALEKRRAALLAMAVAEHFRDRGRHVLCVVDSLTRFAEAHREIALAAGEQPALRAFPPSTAARLSALCERAGPGQEGQGDITAIFGVLVQGSDMEEPVADMVRGTLDGHIVLDRSIAERGRFPAIDLRRSVSRSAPEAWSTDETRLAREARALVAAFEDAAPLIRAGLHEPGTDPLLDRAVALWPALDAFLGEAAEPGSAFPRLRRILGGKAAAN